MTAMSRFPSALACATHSATQYVGATAPSRCDIRRPVCASARDSHMHACTNQVCVAVDSAEFANLGTNCTYLRDGTAKFELILSSLPGSAPIQEARQTLAFVA